MGEQLLLEMKNIRKSFGRNVVLDDVSISLHKGEVLGLIGENGAGKSTLIKILCGIYSKDEGQIIYDGKPAEINTARDAQALGISTIYQELSIMPHLTAIQNIFINRERLSAGKGLVSPLNEKEMAEISEKILHKEMGTDIPLNVPASELSLAQKQMVEIARTVYADAQLIIMDEPTASLQAKEREELFKIIRGLKAKGSGIIFISHHLDELLEICDSLAILRDGHKVADGAASSFTIDSIIQNMIGQSLEKQYIRSHAKIGDEILKVEGLSVPGCFEDIHFSLHRGEVLGIVGLEGCGKNEVVRTLFGLYTPEKGKVTLNGRPVINKTVKTAMKNGFAFLPAERKVEGLFLQRDLGWNTTIAAIDKIISKNTIRFSKERETTDQAIKKLRIKAEGSSQIVSSLSGGNQQKVMISRWMMTDADVFMFEEPTRGIDINAKTEVYASIAECVESGKAVIVITSEEEEALGICNRILVMRDGRISAELNAEQTNTAEIKRHSVKNVD
ncbi:MAG: sugar ABC transporter ATP-binding protein [Butyrivibrio sp.]|nr:sugar ABC transporter ATP-binding protein [Butyrivibrio sp.]